MQNLSKIIERVYSGVRWEEEVSYCRAIKAGKYVFVSGTVSVNEQNEIVGDNMYDQASFIFKKIESVLKKFDMSLSNVIRTRMFVTNIDMFDGLAKAHKKSFNDNPPVATCVEITRLINTELLVEIEVDAYRNEG